jgi:hypothetical protein
MGDKVEKVVQVERGRRDGSCGGLEGAGKVRGDSRQRSCGTWAPSGQRVDPIYPDTLDASALHLVFSHLWTAARPG